MYSVLRLPENTLARTWKFDLQKNLTSDPIAAMKCKLT